MRLPRRWTNEERKKKEVARNKTYDELWDPDEDIKI